MVANEGRDNIIARRLDRLFSTVTDVDGRLYSLQAVSTALRERYGIDRSPQYIQMLRTGIRDNPTINVLHALADFFGVPVSYLLSGDDEVRSIDEQLELLVQLRRHGVTRIAMRAAALSEAGQRFILQAINTARLAEGLPTPDNDAAEEES
ncbi:helix-turn-helix domain-containing protein [Plantactinospora sp. CA-290183]|uniref:helix-turn-helix domain-containing protein n=1 Tax=Plantactinospora sp. CA-290183 TaxID=3240006 RepID=UPI003D8A5CC1